MLISVMIMFVFVVGAGVLLFTTPAPALATPPQENTPHISNLPNDLTVNSLEGTNPVKPSPEPVIEPEEPEQEPVPTVRNLIITYNGRENKDFTARINEKVDLKVTVVPEGVGEVVIWESSNESVFQVVSLDTDGTSARVTGLGRGTATLTASAGEIVAECIVRVR